jgi:hypothetical protein
MLVIVALRKSYSRLTNTSVVDVTQILISQVVITQSGDHLTAKQFLEKTCQTKRKNIIFLRYSET